MAPSKGRVEQKRLERAVMPSAVKPPPPIKPPPPPAPLRPQMYVEASEAKARNEAQEKIETLEKAGKQAEEKARKEGGRGKVLAFSLVVGEGSERTGSDGFRTGQTCSDMFGRVRT